MKKLFQKKIFTLYFILTIAFGLFFIALSSYLGFLGDDNFLSSIHRYLKVIVSILIILLYASNKSLRKLHINFYSILLLIIYIYYIFIVYDDLYNTPLPMVLFSEIEKKGIMDRMLFFVLIPMLASVCYWHYKLNHLKLLKYLFYVMTVSLILCFLTIGIGVGQVINEQMKIEGELNSLNIAYFSGLLMVITLYLSSKIYGFKKNMFFIIGTTISIYGILIAGSRGPLFFTILTCLIYLGFGNYSKRFKFLLYVSVIFLVLLFKFDYTYYTDLISIYAPHFADRLVDTIENNDISGREDFYARGLFQFSKNIYFGDYFAITSGSYAGSYPHNILIESLMTIGLFGSIPLFGLFFICFKRAFKIIKQNKIHSWIALIFIYYFLKGLSSWNLYGSDLLWISMFILLSIPKAKLNYR